MTINLRLLQPHEVMGFWSESAPLLSPAVDQSYGEIMLHQVLGNLVLGNTRMLMILDDNEVIAAVVLSVHQHPCKKVCQISFAGGTRIHEWYAIGLEFVERMAREIGCNSVYIQGRPGWTKLFKTLGYKQYGVLTAKELEA